MNRNYRRLKMEGGGRTRIPLAPGVSTLDEHNRSGSVLVIVFGQKSWNIFLWRLNSLLPVPHSLTVAASSLLVASLLFLHRRWTEERGGGCRGHVKVLQNGVVYYMPLGVPGHPQYYVVVALKHTLSFRPFHCYVFKLILCNYTALREG